jgi:hypothetical protein
MSDEKGSPEKWDMPSQQVWSFSEQPKVEWVGKPPMGWPEAVSNMVIVLAVSAVLIVLFICLWGPW